MTSLQRCIFSLLRKIGDLLKIKITCVRGGEGDGRRLGLSAGQLSFDLLLHMAKIS